MPYVYDGGNDKLNSMRRKLGACPKCRGPLVLMRVKDRPGELFCVLCVAKKQAEPISFDYI